jgi:hypothetical protein
MSFGVLIAIVFLCVWLRAALAVLHYVALASAEVCCMLSYVKVRYSSDL